MDNKKNRNHQSRTKSDHSSKKTRTPWKVALGIFWRTLKVSVRTAFWIVLISGCILAGLLVGVVAGCIITTDRLTDDDLYISDLTTFIYDSKGEVIGQLKGSDNINRIWVDQEDLPEYLLDAFVAIEDERFYTHPGVDVKRTVSAVLGYVVPGMSSHGGSTITQQVVKNITGDDARSVPRKIRELWRAYLLEKDYDKEEILELYANVIYFGQDMYGIQTAAEGYFNKDAKDLSLAECAFLAGVPNSPRKYNPLTTAGRANAYNRQVIILDKMLELGSITQEEYVEAIQTELVFNEDYKASSQAKFSNSYFVDAAIVEIRDDLMALGYTKTQANNIIYNSGCTIYTTQDSEVQAIVDEVYTNPEYFKTNQLIDDPEDQAQSAIVIMDQYTGKVVALYGGYGAKEKNLVFNRATSAARQPGSSIKPILVYGPQVDQHIITAATVVEDTKVYLDPQNPTTPWPTNAGGGYYGMTTVRKALTRSQNVVATLLYKDQVKLGLSYLKKLGIDRTQETQLSAALGGLNQGVSAMEMCAAYVPFANDGIYYTPKTYSMVKDRDGNVILENKFEGSVVYEDYRTPAMMRSLLRSVVADSGGTGRSAQVTNSKGQMIFTAGKTGTTNDYKDVWFVGFTPYYTCAVWYGYDKYTVIPSGDRGSNVKLWKAVMQKVHANKEPMEYPATTGLVQATICTESGLLAGDLCTKTLRETFLSGTEPKTSCLAHTPILPLPTDPTLPSDQPEGTGTGTVLPGT